LNLLVILIRGEDFSSRTDGFGREELQMDQRDASRYGKGTEAHSVKDCLNTASVCPHASPSVKKLAS